MLSAEIVDADGEAGDKEYRQRQQVRQVEIRRFRRHRFGGDGFQTASNRHQGRLKNKKRKPAARPVSIPTAVFPGRSRRRFP